MYISRFLQHFYVLLLVFFINLAIQMGGRLYLLNRYSSQALTLQLSEDFPIFFQTSLLFDIRVACILLAPLLLLGAFYAISPSFFKYWQQITPYLVSVVTLLITVTTLGNIYYYMTYSRNIDVFIFGLFDDDTLAILATVWADYPVIIWVVSLIIIGFLIFKLFHHWQHFLQKRPTFQFTVTLSVIIILLAFTLCFLGARGSVGTFPLRQANSQISNFTLLNHLTPNGAISLVWAFNNYRQDSAFSTVSTEQGKTLLTTFFNQSMVGDPTSLIAKTQQNPTVEQYPPQVVLIIMESLGYHLNSLDNGERSVLGKLREHLSTDLYFERFLSEGNGTIDSLNRLFVRSPISSISQSTAQYIPFLSNMFKPYLDNDYHIIFITSGNSGWRNLHNFLTYLGVTEVIDENTLTDLYPDAVRQTWGVADEFMFRYAYQRLLTAQTQQEKVMIVMLSTTHHPPHRIPESVRYPVAKLTEQEHERFRHLADDQEELQNILGTLRYSNDQAGTFIEQVKQGPLRSNTIIALTGDHNIRGIGYPDPAELVLSNAVPFYLYLPDIYPKGTFDKYRAGSHKDIWPTLYHLSLSATNYYQTGCDLLAEHLDPIWCFGYNPDVIIDQYGAYSPNNVQQYWPWQAENNLVLAPVKTMTESQQAEYQRRKLIGPLLEWQINYQIQYYKKQQR